MGPFRSNRQQLPRYLRSNGLLPSRPGRRSPANRRRGTLLGTASIEERRHEALHLESSDRVCQNMQRRQGEPGLCWGFVDARESNDEPTERSNAAYYIYLMERVLVVV